MIFKGVKKIAIFLGLLIILSELFGTLHAFMTNIFGGKASFMNAQFKENI